MIDDDVDEAMWEELETGIRHQGRITANFLLLMALGGVIAAAGAVAEPSVSSLAYVASAIIAPGFEPVAKIPLGIVLRRRKVLVSGLTSTLTGYAVLMFAAALTFLFPNLARFREAKRLPDQPSFLAKLAGSGQRAAGSGQRAGLRLSTSSAANVNEWQKVESRKEVANGKKWVSAAASG